MKIVIGDRIKFRAVTAWGEKAVWRKVNGFFDERPTVKYGGWAKFIVKKSEIMEVARDE